MIIMSFVEMMVGTAQNIIKLFVAAALYRKLLKVHFDFWSLQHCCLRWYYTGTVSICVW